MIRQTAEALGLYFAVVLLVVGGMLALPALLGERHWRKPQRRQERGLAQPYESGMPPTGSTFVRLPIQYYLVAVFFVIFDLEAMYLYAWAVGAAEAGWTGFWTVTVFVGTLLAALVYLWRIGALDWGGRYQRLVDTGRLEAGARAEPQRKALRPTG